MKGWREGVGERIRVSFSGWEILAQRSASEGRLMFETFVVLFGDGGRIEFQSGS